MQFHPPLAYKYSGGGPALAKEADSAEGRVGNFHE